MFKGHPGKWWISHHETRYHGYTAPTERPSTGLPSPAVQGPRSNQLDANPGAASATKPQICEYLEYFAYLFDLLYHPTVGFGILEVGKVFYRMSTLGNGIKRNFY